MCCSVPWIIETETSASFFTALWGGLGKLNKNLKEVQINQMNNVALHVLPGKNISYQD